MYNSTNLPLSPLKIVKKIIERFFKIDLRLLVPIVIMVLFFKQIPDDINMFFIWSAFIVGLIFLFSVVYEYLYYRLYYYNFGNDRGEIKKGVIAQSSGHVFYNRLQNIYVDQDLLDRVFGLYDVHYETAGEISNVYSHVDGLNHENAQKLTTFLLGKITTDQNNTTPPQLSIMSVSDKQSANMKNDIFLSSDAIQVEARFIFAQSFYAVIAFMAFFLVLRYFGYSMSGGEYLISWSFIIAFEFLLWLIGLCYFAVWRTNFRFEFSGEKGMIRNQVISQSISYLYYNRIQNVTLIQGVIERLFNLYAIRIETAGEVSGRIVLAGFNKVNAEKILSFLLEKSQVGKDLRY